MSNVVLLQALGVTCELLGTQLSEAAVRVLAHDLSGYPLAQVLGALDRCRRELTGRLTLAAIIDRLDDGRPGPEEAWSMIPRDEATSVVWTEEMAAAFGVVFRMIEADEVIPARMAFLETYKAAVAKARNEHVPVKWTPSLGHAPAGREAALLDAVSKGRLSAKHANALLPSPAISEAAALLDRLGVTRNV